ncbi:MAG: ImmA/IrrE family metallo-endopeptidase [bacterium]|jgi:Zn-dependent peptidase ImmA (M78 family)/DNA-binding XRE family transcriptional regulator
MDIGQKIKSARIMRGLSVRELAERVGVSHTAISKYETGKNKPGTAVIIKLARATNLRPSYFLRSPKAIAVMPRFRKRSKVGARKLAQIDENFRDKLERFLEVEGMVGISSDHHHLPDGFPYKARTLKDAEDAAIRLRESWKLGVDAIESVAMALEDNGVHVIPIQTEEDFFGCAYATKLEDGKPVHAIAFNKNLPCDRARFTLAHELGHIVLEPSDGLDEEALCNRFAAAFLAPKETVEKELSFQSRSLSIAELKYLKLKYGMSMQAWLYRARDLGVISDATLTREFRRFSALGWKKKEPVECNSREAPARFEVLVKKLLEERAISISRAAELLGVPTSDLMVESG